MMKFTLNHLFMGLGAVAAVGAEIVGAYMQTGSPLPFHLTAAAGLTVVTVLGAVSKSITADKGAKNATISADVLRAIADSLDAGPATARHAVLLDAVKMNVAADAAGVK